MPKFEVILVNHRYYKLSLEAESFLDARAKALRYYDVTTDSWEEFDFYSNVDSIRQLPDDAAIDDWEDEEEAIAEADA